MKKNALSPLYLGKYGLIYASSPMEVFDFSGGFFGARLFDVPAPLPGLRREIPLSKNFWEDMGYETPE